MRRLVTDTLVIAERNLVRLRAPDLLAAFYDPACDVRAAVRLCRSAARSRRWATTTSTS